MSLENWAINKWLERLESDREEIERLFANADGHLADYHKAVKRPEDWRWSSYNNFALDKATVAACPIQIDDVRLPLGYCA
jgi:hypothetical protein